MYAQQGSEDLSCFKQDRYTFAWILIMGCCDGHRACSEHTWNCHTVLPCSRLVLMGHLQDMLEFWERNNGDNTEHFPGLAQ